jgi:TetR/AcrR family transcriptional regulator, transcriptional repressor for nem operon
MTKGEATRKRIIAKAAELFNSRGFEGSSMQDIMEATGLEKGGLYRHFTSKEELATEAFRYAWDQTWQARSRDLDKIKNHVDKLRHVIANFVDISSPIRGGCPLMNTAIEADDGSPMLRELARKALRRWQAGLVSIIEVGIQAKEIRANVDQKALANLIISTLEGSLMISRLERNQNALRQAQRYLGSYLERICLPQTGT